ncbi:MAG: HAD hydrolase-like protein [Candidatus Omnitrophica bacterium]|nr:HAD hydrolase-like protein [Candidatus Omnitrophota bacterium]
MKRFDEYKTWLFDCDGVLLDSNAIKTEAFYQVGLTYGKREAEQLIAYHKQLGGVSRFSKFKYFFENILEKKEYKEDLSVALDRYSDFVKKMMLECPEVDNLHSFLNKIPNESRKIVVSGGQESEVREVFLQRGLADYFDAIYGSPTSKTDILQELMKGKLMCFPVIFIGDSLYDYEVAEESGIDFVFMYRHTEFSGWKEYFSDKEALIVPGLLDILKRLPS